MRAFEQVFGRNRAHTTIRGLVLLALGLLALPAAAQYNYFPGDEATNDGRFVVLAGDSIETLAQDSLTFLLAVPPGVDQFEIGVFDGETGQVGSNGQRHWDNGSTQLQYALFYDPYQQGSTDPGSLVGVWKGNQANATSGSGWASSNATFPDNDWWSLTVDVPEPPEPLPGQAPSGATFYHLCVSYRAQTTSSGLVDPCTGDSRSPDLSPQTISNFKLRATSNISVLSFAFAYEAAMRIGTNEDLYIIYPEFDGTVPAPGSDFWLTTPTTYDGVWRFDIDVPTSRQSFRLYGGDFDFGTLASPTTTFPSQQPLPPCSDDDDADTPNDAFFPAFAVSGGIRVDGSLPEGAKSSGSPADDSTADIFRRSPCIRWTLTSPQGDTYDNDNPSSQREWEQFLVDSSPACDSSPTCDPNVSNCADHCVGSLIPPGIWSIEIEGVDLSNLNAWRSDNLTGFCISCGELPRPYLVGDTVFDDLDGDGEQDAGEPGISGVLVELLDEQGFVLDTRVTGDSGTGYGSGEWQACQNANTGTGTAVDDQGLYCFDVSVPNEDPSVVDSENYTVRIAASNFQPGGALYDYYGANPDASRPSPSQTSIVSEGGGNVMTYDFGYLYEPPLGSIGDRVWNDADGDGEQDGGETGINGVTVNLLDEDGDVIATQVTSGDGNYLFTDLPAGTYTVEVDASTVPAGLAQTYDLDGLASRDRATVDLAEGENRDDVDFGYAPCGACEGKVTRLTLQYNGDEAVYVKIKAKRGPSQDYVFSDTVQPGEVFEIVGPSSGNGGFYGTLGTEIKFKIDGHWEYELHTSCSVEIGPGTVVGDFEVLAGESKHGGALCPVDGCSDCGGGECVTPDLNFEKDRHGEALHKGTYVDDELPGVWVTTHDPQRHPAMIFDSSHPTGGDRDLGTANENFGGPGRGHGGSGGSFANTEGEGNVLIVSEDGHWWDPDDRAAGGWLIFVFDEPVHVESVGILDVENSHSKIYAYDADWNRVADVRIPKTGDNGKATVEVGVDAVKYLKVYFKESGAVTRVSFCPEGGGDGGSGGGGGSQVGTGTIGYWKNHTSAWPMDEVTVGPYRLSKSSAADFMGNPSWGDVTLILAKQLIATKLNLANGTEESCIEDVVEEADEFIENHPPFSWLSGSDRARGEDLKDALDAYNNGELCAPHRG